MVPDYSNKIDLTFEKLTYASHLLFDCIKQSRRENYDSIIHKLYHLLNHSLNLFRQTPNSLSYKDWE